MKGIILSGGTGTRLYPATHCISKQLLPIYDKPMIYYPISTLMSAGIREFLIITTPQEQYLYQALLQDGKQWGISFEYTTQENPNGIAEAFILGEKFIDGKSVCLMLGDNILYGHGLPQTLEACTTLTEGATVFGYYVNDPERYGVIKFDRDGNPCELIEKPKQFISHYAVIGLYFYDHHVVEIAKQLKPSARGELEITDLSRYYLEKNALSIEKLGRGIAWLDTGTHESMLQASNFIQVLETRQALKIGCPEEVAWRKGYISDAQLKTLATPLMKSGYGEYLMRLL